MLISQTMRHLPEISASDNMASRLSDKIRNIWLDNMSAGNHHWEAGFFEDENGIVFLREESFPYLQGIDYIFKWWNHPDVDGYSGQLEVMWKALKDGKMEIFETTVKFSERDFTRGAQLDENDKRLESREDFKNAFKCWQKLYMEAVGE